MHGTRKAPAPRQARPAQRYFRGKAPKGVEAVDSDSDSEADEQLEQQQSDAGDVPIGGDMEQDYDEDGKEEDEEHVVRKANPSLGKTMNVSLKSVSISNGKVIVDGRAESGRTDMEGM
jgi:microfibrillar-associated protein 1